MFPTSSSSNNNGPTLQPVPPHLNLIQQQQHLNLQLAAAAGMSNLRPNSVSSVSSSGHSSSLNNSLPHHNSSSNSSTVPLSAKCMICDKIFPTQTELEHHMKQHQVADGKKPFTCEICSKSFIQSNNLATHMRIHNNEKNYECSYCGKKFSQSNNMKTHQRFVWVILVKEAFSYIISLFSEFTREKNRTFVRFVDALSTKRTISVPILRRTAQIYHSFVVLADLHVKIPPNLRNTFVIIWTASLTFVLCAISPSWSKMN